MLQLTRRRIHRCPRCHASHVQRVARRGFYERLILPILSRRAYRCRDCNARFHDRKS